MGYTTEFRGKFKASRPFTQAETDYLVKFSETRRMKRDPEIVKELPDPERLAVGLPVGVEGGYYVGGRENGWQLRDGSDGVLDHNHEPKGQPGLWCQWIPNEDGTAIEWDGNEKFYEYIDWIKYIIEHFMKPWDIQLNGKVRWRGEDFDDSGEIIIVNNVVTVEQMDDE